MSEGAFSYVRERGDTIEWSRIYRPTGPNLCPDWVTGACIKWRDGYSNWPDIYIRTNLNAREWSNKRFRKIGDMYIAESSDGRAEVYYHSGSIACRDVPGRERIDGVWSDTTHRILCTTAQDGFGGSHYPCQMADDDPAIAADGTPLAGQVVTLRGPWHGLPPKGWLDCAYYDTTASWRGQRATSGHGSKSLRYHRKWHQQTFVGGLYLTEDLLIRIASTFLPHIELLRVSGPRYEPTIQPIKPEWDAPKCVILDREYQQRRAA